MVKFYHFPGPVRSAEKRRKWINACHRGDNFVRTKDSYVCSAHLLEATDMRKKIQIPYLQSQALRRKNMHLEKQNCTKSCR